MRTDFINIGHMQAWVRDAIQQALGRDVEREYHSLVRIKRRTYKARQLKHLLHTYGSNPRAFWKRLKGLGTQLPLALLDVSVWSAYLHNLCNLPPLGSTSLPAGGFPVRPTAPCSSLNALITHDELVNTLTKQHTGKASGPSGLISELFRYARLTPTKEVPNPPYLLNQGLLALLNSAFTMGHVPPAVNVSLVTPIFKRGDPSVCGNYRPIAVSDPLLKLYASILNFRLVTITEELGYRSPAQCAFRPGLSTLHPLFGLQHLIELCASPPWGATVLLFS